MEEKDFFVEKKECTEDYLKFIVVYIISIAVIFLMAKGVFMTDFSTDKEKPTDIILSIFAAISLFYTYKQYIEYRKRERAEVLGQYNERYSRDEHINKVVDYIIRYMDGEYLINKPTTHDTEMFMRFFEEIQIQIETNRLDENQVFELFAYYAMVFDVDKRLRGVLGINDYENGEQPWSKFIKFSSNMMKYHQLKGSKWKSKNNESLFFCKDDINVECTSEKDKVIKDFTYKNGIVTFEKEKFLYVFSGSDEPDELHHISDDIIYKKELEKVVL